MKAVMVMFDTLSKRYLETYGCENFKTKNFKRLEEKTCVFDNFYAGSLPCIPARRELHTGKYNFMHRSWGPLEPFDFSCIEELKANNIYTHLVTDHSHYFEDGGATYHNRFNTWESFRGQEGDRWTPQDYGTIPDLNPLSKKGISLKQHYANITRIISEEDMPSVKTFKAGLDFIDKHKDKDDWFLQIESFDPHEPFYVPDKYRRLCGLDGNVSFNWPSYGPIDTIKEKESIDLVKREYAALITMCDEYLGKVLDAFDKYNLWEDTYLIVNTDHGFLLGEHEAMGKNFTPLYNELVNIPFYMYSPISKKVGRRKALCQTIDIASTLLDIFNIKPFENIDGTSLLGVLEDDRKIRNHAFFGIHGSYTCVTDGTYVYMQASKNKDNQPLVECSLMPTMMRGFIDTKNINEASFFKGDRYSNNVKYLKIPTKTFYDSYSQKNQLFDLRSDPMQEHNLAETRDTSIFKSWIKEGMLKYDAPKEEFERLGL